MRKMILALATAAAGLAIAAPASAQYYPPNPGYPPQYGNAYGVNYGRANFRALDNRIDMIQRHISQLDRRNAISEREADRLKAQSRDLERRLAIVARNGFSPWEAQNIERAIARLEQRIYRDVRDGRGWGDRRDGRNWSDRDRDGRYDRYEDDRGTRRD
jgi:hypothetical protein